MDDRTRMFKTLISLVVSMTATTALLGWIDPSIEPAPSSYVMEDFLPAAREIVASGLQTHRGAWDFVEITTSPHTGDPSVWLAASSEPHDHHFAIDPTGRLTDTISWRSQRAVRDRNGTLIIHLPVESTDGRPTEAQALATRALVRVLDDMVGLPDAPLSINSVIR